MNRSDDTCEYCKADLPREAIGTVHFCSFECFDANEAEAREQARKRRQERTPIPIPDRVIDAILDGRCKVTLVR